MNCPFYLGLVRGDFYALTHVGMCACVPLAGVTYQRIFVCVSDLKYTQSAN